MKTLRRRHIAALAVSGALLFGSVALAVNEPPPTDGHTSSQPLQTADALSATQECTVGSAPNSTGCEVSAKKSDNTSQPSAQQRFYQRMLILLKLLNRQN